mgnify:CR=1 FL=1
MPNKNKKLERRIYDAEIRVNSDNADKTPKIVGYPAVFESLSLDLGGFREKIQKGAFANTIINSDIRALFNHDPHFVLGRNKNNTLKLEEDNHGLKMENIPPGTQWANDLLISIDRGDITQMSFGFNVPEGGDRWETINGENVRTLVNVELYDVSPVTFPAYLGTEVSVRSEKFDIDLIQKIIIRAEHGIITKDDREYFEKIMQLYDGLETDETEGDRQHEAEENLQLINRKKKQGFYEKYQSLLNI